MYSCQLCDKQFKSAYGLNGHVSIHKAGPRFNTVRKKTPLVTLTCPACSKSFTKDKWRKTVYCSKDCWASKFSKDTLAKNVALVTEGKIAERSTLYKVLVHVNGNKCVSCGISEWKEKPIRFWVNHKNGNASDNTFENLELICPNCDSQSDFYSGRNRGNGRTSRGLPKS